MSGRIATRVSNARRDYIPELFGHEFSGAAHLRRHDPVGSARRIPGGAGGRDGECPGVVGDKVGDFLSSVNPFGEETVDRTGPSVLQSLSRLSDFHAASAHYETVVDLEKDDAYLPDWVSGERALDVAKGDVDAIVDFSELDERRVVRSRCRISCPRACGWAAHFARPQLLCVLS